MVLVADNHFELAFHREFGVELAKALLRVKLAGNQEIELRSAFGDGASAEFFCILAQFLGTDLDLSLEIVSDEGDFCYVSFPNHRLYFGPFNLFRCSAALVVHQEIPDAHQKQEIQPGEVESDREYLATAVGVLFLFVRHSYSWVFLAGALRSLYSLRGTSAQRSSRR